MRKLTPCMISFETLVRGGLVAHIEEYLATLTILEVNNHRTNRANCLKGVEVRDNSWNCLMIVAKK